MARIPTSELSRYLLTGQLTRQGCLHVSRRPLPPLLLRRTRTVPSQRLVRQFSTPPSASPTAATKPVPLRKHLKDQARALKASGQHQQQQKKKKSDNQTVPGWDLVVGIEIHAQLNTARKLFSPAAVSYDAVPGNTDPNTHVALFDAAIPGSQPLFQRETLVPAIRAALALNCEVQRVSHFDRKHYFHWDQPAGYQITQYYEPFARGGWVELYGRDGIAREEGEEGVVVRVGIQRVQMEQDTGKTMAQGGGGGGGGGDGEGESGQQEHWVDLNRVGVPLIEIITGPEIRYPATAAALVRKVQGLLGAVDACVLGMEAGGLRADVNVSVRRTGSEELGVRTEIKNLSSFKAVEDAIIAERDRQIQVLEAGGVVKGETRGWSIGSTETRRLRGKEGEVDYRYMPDPDLGPVVIDPKLVEYLAETSGMSPDAETDQLIKKYGLTAKDAMSLMSLDDGARVQYFYHVLDKLEERLAESGSLLSDQNDQSLPLLAANWCLHELGKLTELASDLEMTPEGECKVASADLATILYHLWRKDIVARVAKEVLFAVFRGDIASGGITEAIDREGLWFEELSEEEYASIADAVVDGEDKVLKEFLKFADGKAKAYPQGKLMFLVGKMMRTGPEQRMDPASAERVMRARIDEVYLARLRAEQ